MPKKMESIAVITDDLDGKELSADTVPVALSIGNKHYDLYLSDDNAGKLYAAVEKFTKNASPVRGKGAKKTSGSSMSPAELAEVRAWAKKNGHKVSDRGRIAAEVLTAYKAAK